MALIFDTHAHYDDRRFDKDRHTVLSGLPGKGVGLVLNPGCDISSSRLAVSYAEKYPHVYAAAGIHPGDAGRVKPGFEHELEVLLKHPKCMALGEVGLDYHYSEPPKNIQLRVLETQFKILEHTSMPVIFHDRDAHADSLQFIKRHPGLYGVFHCFSGSPDMARELIRLGWYVSFTGVLTFPNARRVLDTLQAVPPERVMLETDAPYMAPQPWRGQRCDSSMLSSCAEVLAQAWGVSADRAIEITFQNGVELFGLSSCL